MLLLPEKSRPLETRNTLQLKSYRTPKHTTCTASRVRDGPLSRGTLHAIEKMVAATMGNKKIAVALGAT